MYEDVVRRLRKIIKAHKEIYGGSTEESAAIEQAADAIEKLSALVDASAEDSAALLMRVTDRISRWISVTEKLPESGKVVIGYNGKRRFVTIVRVSRDSINLITHWMPLPEPPKEGTK